MKKVLESVALEVESFTRDVRAALALLDAAEIGVLMAALAMALGCFLPWFATSHTHTQTGMDGFATPHFGISLAIILLVRRIVQDRQLRSEEYVLPGCQCGKLEPGRIALYFLLLGAFSTLTCIALLIHFGDIAAYSNGPVDVRYGFYVVLFSGVGVSVCGTVKLR